MHVRYLRSVKQIPEIYFYREPVVVVTNSPT